MDDQMDFHLEDSKISDTFSSDSPPKHVQFAEHPIVFKNVRFHFTSKLTCKETLFQKPNESCLKNTEDYIQVPDENDPQFTKCSIFIFLLLISFLFFIIWYTVSKLLMFEIDTQLGDYIMKQMTKQST